MKATTVPASRWKLHSILLLAGLYLGFAGWNVLYSGVNSDEGFYALAARSVWNGDLPYRDFGYTQMPLLPYINGLAMQFTGYGLFQQRAVNGLWGALTLLLAVRWLARRTTPGWALGFGALLSLSVPWMCFVNLGKTYAFAGLIIVGAVWVYTEWNSGARKVCALALLSTIGIGCRLTTAPFFIVLWVAAASELPIRARRIWLMVVLGSVVWPAILLLPFYLAAPEASFFWTLNFHQLSVPNKHWHILWPVIVALAPAFWLGLTLGIGHAIMKKQSLGRYETVLIVATVLALAANLLPSGVYEEYGVPFLPPLGLLAAVGLWRMGVSFRWFRHPSIFVGLAAINFTAGIILLWPWMPSYRHTTLSIFLPLNAGAYDTTLPARLVQQTRVIRQYLPADQPFIGPKVILAVEADRIVPRALRMGPFAATLDFPSAEANRLNLTTFAKLEAYLNDPNVHLLAFYKNGNLNYAWSMPTFRNPPEETRQRWLKIFHRDFLIAYEDADTFLLIRKSAFSTGH